MLGKFHITAVSSGGGSGLWRPSKPHSASEPSLRAATPSGASRGGLAAGLFLEKRDIRRRGLRALRASFFARGEKSRGGGLSGPIFLQKAAYAAGEGPGCIGLAMNCSLYRAYKISHRCIFPPSNLKLNMIYNFFISAKY